LSIIFGPINSRRFGRSLGVDLSPNTKQCNFDCLYCELKSVSVVDSYKDVVSTQEIVAQIKEALSRYKDIDVLTLTANGEPTLYPHLDELIDSINSFKGDIKTLILSNASTIYKKATCEALLKLDSVKLSLDCASAMCFKKLDRADSSVDLEKIKEGMLQFKEQYSGNLLIEILFVEGINDNLQEVAKLNEFLLKLKPARIDIGTIDRPPAYNIKPVSYDKLYNLSLGFSKELNIAIATKQNSKIEKFNYTKAEILQTLSLRPLTIDDINMLFSSDSKDRFKELLNSGKIEKVDNLGVEFYRSKQIWEM